MPYIGYTIILAICFVVGLVAFGKVNERLYPYLLYGIGASMVLMTTLAGPYLVGSDIHLEYYYAQLHSGGNVLEPEADIPQATSIVNTVIAPLLPIPLLWTYKVVYPMLFALIPVLLYFVFRKWITTQQAFIASFMVIVFPAFFIELPTIARQMVAEFFFALILYLLVVSSLRMRHKVLAVSGCMLLLPMLHYSIGLLVPVVLGTSLLLSWRFRRSLMKPLGAGLLSCLIIGAIYFPLAGGGAVATWVVHIYNSNTLTALQLPWDPKLPNLAYNPTPDLFPGSETSGSYWDPAREETNGSLISKYEIILQGGMGADFFKTTFLGKVFRVLQWVIAILVVVGLWKLRKHKDYWIFAAGGIILLVLLMAPRFSSILNSTRVLHLSLFLLAPMFAIALKPKYLLIVLLPYFLFTSGFIFEVTRQPDVEELTIPYNVALTNHRLDLGASITKDDERVRDYVMEHWLFPLYSDIWTSHYMGEVLGWRDDINRALERTPGKVPNGYVFVRSRNIEEGTFTNWNGIGCRRSVSPEEYGINWDENIVYQSGDSRVVEVK